MLKHIYRYWNRLKVNYQRIKIFKGFYTDYRYIMVENVKYTRKGKLIETRRDPFEELKKLYRKQGGKHS